MYDLLISLDHELFLFINHLPHVPLSDMIAMTVSAIGFSWIIWGVISVLIFVREEKKDHTFFVPVFLAGALAAIVTEWTLKNVFDRSRPPLDLGAIIVGPPLADHSFPSGHATFAWALAVVLASKEPHAKYVFYSLATLISFSRIYLGFHYPADIIAGTAVGILIGWVSLWAARHMVKYHHDKVKRQRAAYPRRRSRSR